MRDHQASRTLLKSPPELWAECSEAQSLARHLGEAIGEIRITRLEPEITVAWEGERVSGTVRLEPSGWGTKVTLTATEQSPEPSPVPAPQPATDAAPEPPARAGFMARVRRLFAPEYVVEPPPSASAPVVEAPPAEPNGAAQALTAALESLGKAHHRPFSRA
jgi:hypothetical protein